MLRNLRVDSTITTVLWQPTAPGTPLSTVEKLTWARENTWVCVGVELSCYRMAIGIADCAIRFADSSVRKCVSSVFSLLHLSDIFSVQQLLRFIGDKGG